MKLTNSITKELQEIKPVDGKVTLYSCGPTVYDHAHIGNLRTFILDDVLRRTLRAEYGDKLQAIMNITDIDDKTINRAQLENVGEPIAEALSKTTRHYETLFLDDLSAVGVDLANVKLVRATDSIEAMQSLIREIFANGFAYVSEGSVYFDVAAYTKAGNDYGVLVKVDFEAQARIDNDEYDKQEARDFVLWKGYKEGEPSWDFELDGQLLPGRPGWHIECSAMASELGLPLSLHSGGIDLKFPHHENEIAQTQAGAGKSLAEAFIHYGHLFVDGRKMSKSLGNFYRLQDIIDKGYSPLAFRILVLQSRYDSELNFTWEALEQAQANLLDLYAKADLQFQSQTPDDQVFVNRSIGSMEANLLDDLDTPTAVQLLVKGLNEISEQPGSWNLISQYLTEAESIFGLGLINRRDITDEQKDLISQRETARQEGHFAKADELRDILLAQNIAIDDTPHGARWRRTTI